MTKTLSRVLWAHVACLSLWPVSLLAGAPDPSPNLLACQKALVAAERLRNYTACVKGRGYCDRSRLTPAEAARVPVVVAAARQP
jgi:hypothetical protein